MSHGVFFRAIIVWLADYYFPRISLHLWVAIESRDKLLPVKVFITTIIEYKV